MTDQRPTAPHSCAWFGCETTMPGHILMCRSHWFRLPSHLRARINRVWRTNPYDREAHVGLVREALTFSVEQHRRATAIAEAKKAEREP